MTHISKRQQGAVLHYLRMKALENIQSEGQALSTMFQHGTDTRDGLVQVIGKCKIVDGLMEMARIAGITEKTIPVKKRQLKRGLNWFARELTFHTEMNRGNDAHYSLDPAMRFVIALIKDSNRNDKPNHPEIIPGWDEVEQPVPV